MRTCTRRALVTCRGGAAAAHRCVTSSCMVYTWHSSPAAALASSSTSSRPLLPWPLLSSRGRASAARCCGAGACVTARRCNSSAATSEVTQSTQGTDDNEVGGGGGDAATAASATNNGTYDPWRVLGLPAGSPAKVLRSRYHELMRQVHPDLCGDGVGDMPRLAQINKAYELLTRSPTLDTRYRNLITDRQYTYYRFLPEWMARNVEEMPRYWNWVRWRVPTGMQVAMLCAALYTLGRLFRLAPTATTVLVVSWGLDVLLHTTLAPAALALVLMYTMISYRSSNMAWLTSPKDFLRRDLGY